jgi:hydrogenase expression/formation protein HypD
VLDHAIQIAGQQNVIFCTFGDMLRVPGTSGDLMLAKANGAHVEIVYSPLDAVKIAQENPDKEVVFFAVGFETTAPANAMAVHMAHRKAIQNFTILTSQVLVPPALETLLQNEDAQIDAFLAAGHVCTIMGTRQYDPIAETYNVPIVVTGFEPVDILQGLYLCIRQLENGKAFVENQYLRSVEEDGNEQAQKMLDEVFRVQDKEWRGMGSLENSGLALNEKYKSFDACRRFILHTETNADKMNCISGEILQGLKKPNQCPHFGTSCTPEHPFGATMVSSEGACSAYYMYREDGANP